MNLRLFPKLSPEEFAMMRRMAIEECPCCDGLGFHPVILEYPILGIAVIVGARFCTTCYSGQVFNFCEN